MFPEITETQAEEKVRLFYLKNYVLVKFQLLFFQK